MRRAASPEAGRRPTYKGNVGNLMQHWTLCEILSVAQRHASCLSYVDAHAMAPVAPWRCAKKRNYATFDHVRGDLGKCVDQQSIYEQAWRRLVQGREGYPNSAAFVEDIWKGSVSMLLCETDPTTAAELKTWARGDRKDVTVFEGDWRQKFKKRLPDGPLTLLSFDPYMYNRHQCKQKPSNLYSSDLELTVCAVDALRGGVLLQLSTYDTNYDNPQEAVISSVDAILAKGCFRQTAVVRVNGKMMSLVYTRGIDWFEELVDMPKRFKRWLDTHR